MELDDCFLCNEPLWEPAPSNLSEDLRQQHAQTLIRLFSFIHQYSAAESSSKTPIRLPRSLQGLQTRLKVVKYCKRCTVSLRQLVQTFKTYDNLGKKLEGCKSDWIGRLQQIRPSNSCSSVSGTNQRLREEIFNVVQSHDQHEAASSGLIIRRPEGNLGPPVVKLRRMEQIPALAGYIKQDPGIQRLQEIKQEPEALEMCPDIHGDIDMSPGAASPAPQDDDSEGEITSDSEDGPDEAQTKQKPSRSKKKESRPRRRQTPRTGKRLHPERVPGVQTIISTAPDHIAKRHKSVMRLVHLRQHACDYTGCQHVFETCAQLEEHTTSIHTAEPRPWICNQEHAPTIPCTGAFFQEASLIQHVHYVHSTRFKYPCPKCLQGFDEYRHYERHQRRDHDGGIGIFGKPIKQQRSRAAGATAESEFAPAPPRHFWKPYFPCDFVDEGCEFRGREEDETQRHLEELHPNAVRVHVCECGARFVTEHRLGRHKHWVHSGARYPCQDCDHVCDDFTKQQLHRLRAHGEGVQCPHPGCDYMAPSTARLRTHLESSVHAGEPDDPGMRKHMCQHCGRRFMSSQTLRYHIHSRHPELVDPKELAKYKCPHCGKISASPPILRDHIKNLHEQDFRFHCEKCGAGFRYENRLRSHMRSHLQPHEFEYECTVCGAKFRHNSVLKAHMRRHTGNFKEEHACSHCGKNFTNAGARRRHERIHAAVLEHVCPVCNKGFPLRNYLVTHLRSHETAEQKEARKQAKKEAQKKLPPMCKVYFETTKKDSEVQVPYPLHYVQRGARQNVSRILAPEEVPQAAKDEFQHVE